MEMKEFEMRVRRAKYEDRLNKLEKKGGNARIVAKLKRRLKVLEGAIAA